MEKLIPIRTYFISPLPYIDISTMYIMTKKEKGAYAHENQPEISNF